MGLIWLARLLWLSILALSIFIVASVALGPPPGLTWGGAGGLGIFLGLLGLAVVIVMGICNVSFSDLFKPHAPRGPQPHRGRLVIHGSGGRFTAIATVAIVLGGGLLPGVVRANGGGSLLSLIVLVVELGCAIAIAVAFWLRRTIVVDAKTVTLMGVWGNVAASCERAKVASIHTEILLGHHGVVSRLCDQSGRHLLTIPLMVLFTDREMRWLASYLAVAATGAMPAASPSDFPFHPPE